MSAMNCGGCGRTNRAGARFCDGCGKPLVPRCPGCNAECRPDAQFCDACGASLVARPANDAVARKVVTIVFADLIGSTSLHERLDPESVSRVMDRYYRAVRGPVDAHGGTVVQLLGDGVMCAFGVPRVAEDDAIRAVRAAVAIQQAFREFAREEAALVGTVGLRVAVNTGEVVVSDEYAAGIGDPLNVAARLQQEAQDGQILIGEATQRLVGDLVTLARVGTFALKGRAEGVTAYRVVSLERPAGTAATPFVGRDDELRRLMAVYEAAVAAPGARLAVILGSPGLGKSRLLAELARRLGDRSTVLAAHCDAAGGATFAPLAATLRTYLRLDDGADRDGVRAAVGAVVSGEESTRIADGIAALVAGTPASPEETFFVVRRLLAAIAATRPVVLAIDDLQWAEPLLLDLTEHLVQWSTGVPLLVLVAARPELRDVRSSLATPGGLVTDVVTLVGLDAAAATRLAANVVGADALPAAIAGRVLATSEGNPLFVGELVRMLVQDGALKREGDRWIMGVELAALEMPPTIQALLAARIERLRPEERAVLERAAVVGRQFSRTAVAQLLPREFGDLDARLESLRRSELIEPDVGWLLGEPVLRFHHVLIRDAAYRRVLKGTRAELHTRFADWLESKVNGSVEHDETLGWHLEQAHQNLRDLGPLDVEGRALGGRAARYLAAAGRRALARDDVPVAASLVGRALARLDETDPGRADLALDWCEALLASGDVATAAKAIAELGRFVDGSERLRGWHTCLAGQHAVLTDPQSLRATVDAVAAAAETLAGAGDAAGEAKAHHVHAMALARLGKVGECEAALDRALAAARRGDDRRRANAVLSGAPLAALWGPSPVTRASGRCLDVVRVLRITQGAPAVEAVALRCQAVLEALRGRTDAARRMLASSRRLVEELGITQRLLEADVAAGQIELYEGDAAAAERGLRAAYDGLRAHGLGIDAAQAAALLGRALLALGRDADAEALSHESEALAGDDLRAAVAWRGVRAEALARRGEHAAAVELARAAVAITSATDALLDHADARRALGAALRAAGRSGEADAEEARTIELWEAKGATLLVERARGAHGAAERRVAAPHPLKDRSARRRVRPNAVATNVTRFDAAIAARDADALAALLADDHELVDHPNGRTYGRAEVLEYLDPILRAKGLAFSHELVATVGTSLALFRGSQSLDELAEDDGVSFGKSLYEFYIVIEGNADQHWRVEQFADDHLADAVARLYARYAEILPDGPARDRAAATARSVAAMLLLPRQPNFIDAFAAAVAPDIEFVDHQPVGFGSARGAQTFLGGLRTLTDLTEGATSRSDDVFGLRPDMLLARQTNFGAVRAGGGTYERQFLALWTFGANGLLTRLEWFPTDREDEALARFDALAAGPSADDVRPPVRPRVRANVATAQQARLDAAIAARDADAMAALFAEDGVVVHHPTGVDYDVNGILVSYRPLLSAREATHRFAPLATLGDTLALSRLSVSTSGDLEASAALDFSDFGAIEITQFTLIDVDAHGLMQRGEFFAADRLADGIARLYGRYAELLPAGPARDRAAATARSVERLLCSFDLDRWAPAIAPDVQFVDHRSLVGFGSTRGAQAMLRVVATNFEVADDVAVRCDQVIAAEPDALLVRSTISGKARVGGGAYERETVRLCRFGADGLMIDNEVFDVGREAEALARFDELARASAPSPAALRRVRPNAATAHAARCDVAATAPDVKAALAAEIAPEAVFVHHPTGTTYDRRAALDQEMIFASLATLSHEPLATLGDSLALCRRCVSFRGVRGGDLDVGPATVEQIVLIEVDAQGRNRRLEVFAENGLIPAVARLYERYADLLPAGQERDRAAATARSVANMTPSRELDRLGTVFAPTVETVDHRTAGFGSGHGLEWLGRVVATAREVADDPLDHIDDVLVAQPNALLLRVTMTGRERLGGGAFESPHLRLHVFDADGLVARNEVFNADCEREALARLDALTAAPWKRPARRICENAATALAARKEAAIVARDADARVDELTAGPPAHGTGVERAPARRRVPPNAATTNLARTDTAFAARDLDTLADLLADTSEFVHHPTGTTYEGREAGMSQWRKALRTEGPTLTHEPLASLGDSLALCRRVGTASAVPRLDFGAIVLENIVVVEVDPAGRRLCTEIFAENQLGDAVARLYTRYADGLPEGSERSRAAATARGIAAVVAFDLRRVTERRFAPDVEFVDHRRLGLEPARGAEAAARRNRALLELADDFAFRVDDVLGTRPDTILWHATLSGTDRASGGAFEQPHLDLRVFGADGRQTRTEFFDVDRVDEALARFDALAARSAERHGRRVHANAATATAARFNAAMAARDADALPPLYADDFELVDHTTGVTYGREGVLSSLRFRLSAHDPTSRTELLATLGDSLELARWSMSASGFSDGTVDVGAFEQEHIGLTEVDARGRRRWAELFAADRLGDAVVRLYERYAELLPDGPARARAAATARSVAAMTGPVDLVRLAAAFAPAIECVDHRLLGTWSARGAEPFLHHYRSVLELAEDVAIRDDDVLGLRYDALLVRPTHCGTARAGGGAYEREFLALHRFGADGLVTRIEYFDADRCEADALARFDAMTAEPLPSAGITNAATRSWDRHREAWEARDWDRFAAIFAPGFRQSDRRTMMHLEVDRDEHLQSMRLIFDMTSARFSGSFLATRGERLALQRGRFEGSDRNVGPSEAEWLGVVEVDDAGDRVAVVMFDPDDLDGAYAELDRRYAAGEAAPYARAWETYQRFVRAVAARDWEELASVFDPDLVFDDHRLIGWGTLHSSNEYLTRIRALVDLAPDVMVRLDHVLALDDRGTLGVGLWVGRREGGPFEIPFVAVTVLAPDGRGQRMHVYDLHQLDAARACFEAIRAGAVRDPLAATARPTAATVAADRWHAAFAAHDWAALRALCAPDATFEDRRHLALVSGDVDWWIADNQRTTSLPNVRIERQLVSMFGDRVAFYRLLLTGEPDTAADAATESRRISSLGPFEIEFLWVGEVDEGGRVTAGISFDVDDWRAATREARARWFARDAAAAAAVGPAFELIEAFNDRDRTRMRAVLSDDFVLDDHRPARLGTIEDAGTWVEACATLWDLAPDVRTVIVSTLAHARYGSALLVQPSGTSREGGAFESPSAAVFIVADGRITRQELFEPEDLDAALARFAELRPDSLRIPPNAATRACDRVHEAGEAQDWDALRPLCAPTLVYDDRRRGLRTSGDLEMYLASWRHIFSHGARATRTLLATSGDRLALYRHRYSGADGRPAFEIDTLSLTEVDAEGRIVARLWFDPDDLGAAFDEAHARFVAGEAGAAPAQAVILALDRALARRDWLAFRACLADDLVYRDHRKLGLGTLACDELVAAVRVHRELATDLRTETHRLLGWDRHGCVAVMHQYGTVPDGGPFENVFLRMIVADGDRVRHFETFDVADQALARFEELQAEARA